MNRNGNPSSLRPFQKGRSGNPGGRPKIVGEIRDLAREAAPEAFARVVELIDHPEPRVALAAAQEILNRAYGRPEQAERDAPDEEPVIVEIRRVLVDVDGSETALPT